MWLNLTKRSKLQITARHYQFLVATDLATPVAAEWGRGNTMVRTSDAAKTGFSTNLIFASSAIPRPRDLNSFEHQLKIIQLIELICPNEVVLSFGQQIDPGTKRC